MESKGWSLSASAPVKKGRTNGTDGEGQRYQYPTALDPQPKSQNAWAVHYYPTYAVVDRKGVVRIIGLQPENVEKFVQKLLKEAPPAVNSQAKMVIHLQRSQGLTPNIFS